MPTDYPDEIDAFVNPLPDDDMDVVLHDQQHANANDAITAIETELGTNPSSSFDTVKDRLDDIATDVATNNIGLQTHTDPPGLDPDPHPGIYQKDNEKDQNNGYAGLDASGLVPDARIASTIARDSEVASAISTHAAGAVMDGDTAGGVLSGTYPNPGFAADMATQAELNTAVQIARMRQLMLMGA